MDEATLDHIAALARLEISPATRHHLVAQLGQVLAFFEQLAVLPTEAVEPTAYPTQIPCPLRADEAAPSVPADQMLAAAPGTDGEFYRVPRTVGG